MKILSLLFVFCITKATYSQNLSAKYSVTKSIEVAGEDPNNNKVVSLDFDGYLYKKDSIYISYLKPLYLNTYPDGYISDNNSPNNNYQTTVVMDTIQFIRYISMDSLIKRTRFQSFPSQTNMFSNAYRKFEVNYQQWEILPEAKIIDGLKCQRAKWYSSGSLQYDVWFCADLPIEVNFDGIIGLPGLVVEGENVPIKMKFALKSYELNASISDATMWPKEFNEGFRTLAPIKKRW